MSACSATSAISANGSSASGSGSGSGTMSGLPPNPNNHPCYDKSIGWYSIGGNEQESFAAYLHNPYGYDYLSKPTKDAVDYAKNNNTIFPQIDKKLYGIIHHFFGNRTKNQMNGLSDRYRELYSVFGFQLDVMKNCTELIGLIIWGADGSHPDIKISLYTTNSGETITLTVQSICYKLIKEYIGEKNLEKLCALP